MLVLVFYLCPSSVRVVATFSGTLLFPLLCSVLPFFSPNTFFSLSNSYLSTESTHRNEVMFETFSNITPNSRILDMFVIVDLQSVCRVQ